MKTAAIPTKYGGIQFRSRTEAKWAAFMDLLGWDWDYEPLDFNGYIPDFLVNDLFWLEVKAAMSLEELKLEAPKVYGALAGMDREAIIVGGKSFFPGDSWAYQGCGAPMGIAVVDNYSRLTEEFDGVELNLAQPSTFDTAEWRACSHGWSTATSSTDWTFTCGCGHKDGYDLETDELTALWHEASNLTQWKSPNRQ